MHSSSTALRLTAPADSPPDAGHRTRWFFGDYARSPRQWGDREICFVTLALCALILAGVYHPHWVRGGDSEVFLGIGRHLARGNGFTYNGQPVGLVPPGWPLVLAGGMWFTSLIGVLKLLLVGSILVYLGCAYRVLRRFAGPGLCAATVLSLAIMHPTVQLSTWFHSDAFFLALSWASLLVALRAGERFMQLRERGATTGVFPQDIRLLIGITAALALLAGAITVRWPGVLWCPMIALAFVNGRRFAPRRSVGRWARLRFWPERFDLMWVAAVGAGVVAMVTFFGLRAWVHVEPQELDPRYNTFVSGAYDLVNEHGQPTVATHVERFLRGPEWLSVLYWNVVGRTRPFSIWMFYVAAITVAPLTVAGLVGLSRGQWLWLGVAAAWLPIMVTWPHAIDRYSMPVAPMLIGGTLLGTSWLSRHLGAYLAARWPERERFGRTVPWLLITPAILVFLSYNLVNYGIEASIARGDVYARYEGGVQPSLNRIGYYLRLNEGIEPGELAVTGVRRNYDSELTTLGPRRNAIWLADRAAIDVPAALSIEPDAAVIDWLEANDIRWYIWLPPQKRFMHFRGRPWMSDSDAATRDMDWKLYEIVAGEARRVDVRDQPHEVLVVPGLEDVRSVGGLRARVPIPYN